MGSRLAAVLGFIMESCFLVCGKHHTAGSVYDTIVRVSVQVVYEVVEGLIGDCSVCSMLSTYVIEGH